MKHFLKLKKNKGFLAVEILVAISIIAVSVLAAMTVAQKSISLSRQSFHISQASFLLEEGAEAVRVLRDTNWTNVSNLNTTTDYYPLFDGNTWTLSVSASKVGIFTRKINMQNVNRNASNGNIISSGGTLDPDTKLFIVTVSWPEGGKTIIKTLSFYLANIFS